MKVTFCIFLIFSTITLFSQDKYNFKDYHLESKYVLKGSNDTIKSRAIALWAFRKTNFAPNTYINKLTTIDENGKKTKVKEEEIDYLEIKDFDGKIRKFVSNSKFKNLPADRGLYEEKYVGKMSWYVDYYVTNIYGNIGSTEFLVEEGKELIQSGLFSSTAKKLKERFKENPKILELFDKVKTANDFIEILELYNKN